jgi:hypothetical protein
MLAPSRPYTLQYRGHVGLLGCLGLAMHLHPAPLMGIVRIARVPLDRASDETDAHGGLQRPRCDFDAR